MNEHVFPYEQDQNQRRTHSFADERERYEREISKAKNHLVSLGKRFVLIIALAAILLLIFRGQWHLTFWDFAILALCVFVPHAVLLLEILAKFIKERRNLQIWKKVMMDCAESDAVAQDRIRSLGKGKTN
jgi:hypothetical protein